MNPRLGSAGSRRSTIIGVVAVVAALSLSTACNRGRDRTESGQRAGERPSDALVVGLESDPTNLDPRLSTDAASSRILELVCEGLVRLEGDGTPVPALAASWDSPDDHTYVFHLRGGVTFSDGSPFSSEDVKATLESILDASFASPHRGALRDVKSIEARDPTTLVVTLEKPFAPLLTALSVGIVPAAKARDRSLKMAQGAVCTGPYRVTRFASGDRVVLESNERFRGAAPAIRRIDLKILTDEATRALELRKGSVHFLLNGVSPDRVAELEREPGLAIVRAPSANTNYLGFNLEDPLLSDVRVRRAIAYAIDRDAIIDHLLGGHAIPATGLLPPSSWAYESQVSTYAHDPVRARALLDEAGKSDPDGAGPGTRFKLIHKTSEDKLRQRIAEVMQSQLAEVGIAVEIQASEWGTFFEDIKRGNFQTYTLQWVGLVEPDILHTVFHSGNVPPAGSNRGRFRDARIDTLTERAHTLLTPAERKPVYAEIQRILADELPYVFLWHEGHIAVMSKRLEGFRLDARGGFRSLAEARWTPAS